MFIDVGSKFLLRIWVLLWLDAHINLDRENGFRRLL